MMKSMIEQQNNNKKRVIELDFLKSIFILLMISFHLAYFADGYPYLKQFVYTFHMPGFLIISGYLMNVKKPIHHYAKTMLWIAIPYVIMESGYVLMASILPIREHVDNLTISVFLNKLVVNPLGPYWYLHTLMICGVLYFAVFCWKNISIFSRLIILGLSYYFISLLEVPSLACTMYFMVGVVIRQSGFPFLDVFRKSWWAFVVLIVLFLHPETFDKATFGGALIVYFVFSASLFVYPHIPGKAKDVFLFLGRNSLPLYIFSPIFTICCKVFIPFLSFDSTRLLFLVVSLPICVVGCLVTCKVLDLLRISPLMFGRKHVMV